MLPRSPHGRADGLRARLRSAGGRAAADAAAALLAFRFGAEAGLEGLESLVDLREASGALGATV